MSKSLGHIVLTLSFHPHKGYKPTLTSLLTNEKAETTFTRQLLCPNRIVAGALPHMLDCLTRGTVLKEEYFFLI